MGSRLAFLLFSQTTNVMMGIEGQGSEREVKKGYRAAALLRLR